MAASPRAGTAALTWLELNRIPVGQFYTIHVDMAEPYNIYGGLQDNGSWRGSSKSEPDDEDAWTFLNGGDGFHVRTDERDGRGHLRRLPVRLLHAHRS